jgi:hypothetical protein
MISIVMRSESGASRIPERSTFFSMAAAYWIARSSRAMTVET